MYRKIQPTANLRILRPKFTAIMRLQVFKMSAFAMQKAQPSRVASPTLKHHFSGLHKTSGEGPQPETLFRPNATQLSGGRQEGEPELPFPNIEKLDYEGEEKNDPKYPGTTRPSEPENPLPNDLPGNQPKEPTPERTPPEIDPRTPQQPETPVPREIPNPDVQEFPLPQPPMEVPQPGTMPEFPPPGQVEMPDRGSSPPEIQFPV